jgi:hypothetical protein
MQTAIIRSIKNLQINNLHRRMLGEFNANPWFDNFVIKLIYLQIIEVKIVAMVLPNLFVVALASTCRSK